MGRTLAFTFLICAAALTCAPAGRARGEKCPALPSPARAYATAAAVFVGTVKSQGQMFSMTTVGCVVDETVVFTVEKPYFGVTDPEVTIYNTAGRVGFKGGEKYLVYAYPETPAGGLVSTLPCTRTRPLAEAGEDLLFLDDAEGPLKGVTIAGRVYKRVKGTPLAGVKVRVRGNGRTYDLVTDAAGRYSVGGLAAGRYEVRARVPWRMEVSGGSRVVTVADRGLLEEDFAVRSRFGLR